MFASQSSLANYRRVTGRPKRGIQPPVEATRRWIQRVRDRATDLSLLSDRSFTETAGACRRRIQTPADALRIDHAIESFALTTEALRRTTGMVFHDVQLLGGFALAAGTIAEIQTGEGKTVTTALPAVLHAWSGRGVHVATTNEYLSRRDHEQLKPVFESLGLTSGLLCSHNDAAGRDEKRRAYACDVTYGPGYEFGFDFLRDQVSRRQRFDARLGDRFLARLDGKPIVQPRLAQRGHAFAIIDEADSVLIDEAVTPLVLSGTLSNDATDPAMYQFARQTARALSPDHHYIFDLAQQTVQLTADGWKRVHQHYATRPHGAIARPWSQLVENALRAELILRRDVDYVIKQGTVQIVDQHTGRIHRDRKWSGGLHQAVETKELVDTTGESDTQARITRQRYLGFYEGIAGLTGTATGGEMELHEFYRLPVVRIPTNQPCRRKPLPLRCFDTRLNKIAALADDTEARRRRGQPVLIGTRTVEESLQLSSRLALRDIPHVVLNGLQNEEEASIIARAGSSGAVTIATNMAGRGTDIKPSGQAIDAGGLHVAGCDVHPCRRVDRQLAGRTARQGDPGSYQFYVSAEDDLVRSLAPSLGEQIRASAGETGETRQDFQDAVRRIQQQSEAAAFLQRQHMVNHDDWMESVQSSLAKRA